ncbi:MAG: hypothetical protein ACI9MR_001387 [Myxococcota bacterium]|jgi:hypothetical protein
MRRTPFVILAALSLLVGAGCSDDASTGQSSSYQPDPDIGATSFVSAAGALGGADRGTNLDDSAQPPVATPGEGGDRTVEEGDIYRVLADGLILNLNTYRGLQVIDVSDPTAPTIVGALRVSGTPVEMYVVGDQAIVLLNQWRSYYGSQFAPDLTSDNGGGVLLVDLTDPTQPALLDHHTVQGTINTSRLTQGGGGTAVYVAAALWQDGGTGGGVVAPTTVDAGTDSVSSSGEHTIVTSLEVGPATLTEKSTIDLGGWISDIQATTEALLVARTEWDGEQTSKVAIIDISDPSGTMVQGAEVEVAGTVESQFNMDLQGSVLRVVSGGRWNDTDTNHLQTFDVADIQTPTLIDHETFGDGEQLYATLFVGNKAFFVTYFVTDPFHAFEISDTGDATEMSEFIVSGWNDFFRTVYGEDRLIGVGTDDEGGKRAVAVSLYDITDLTSASPLLQRAEVDMENSWSEASWDHRAFSVLENATSIDAAGVTETGMVLVPFNGWSGDSYQAGTQIFTFSDTTLTARGVMSHGSPVRRTFAPSPDLAANLSDVALSLFDTSDPATPAAQGSLDLAPSYSGLLTFGDYFARLENAGDYGWWGSQGPAEWDVDIVATSDHPDSAPATTSIPVKAGASIVKSGDLLVATSTQWVETPDDKGKLETTFDVWNLSDPTAPTQSSTFTTDGIQSWSWGYGGGVPSPADDCWDCGGWYSSAPTPLVVGAALVFVEGVQEQAPAGTRRVCITAPIEQGDSTPPDVGVPSIPTDPSEPPPAVPDSEKAHDGDETYTVGEVVCVSVNGGEDSCWGQLWECSGADGGCTEIDVADVETKKTCEEESFDRYWTRWVLKAVDLSDPSAPALITPVELPTDHAGVGSVIEGSTLWVSTRTPHIVEGDSRSYFKYWATTVDFASAGSPTVGPNVNVPGTVLDVDGADLYTQDYAYNDTSVESALSRLTVADGVATLAARKRFDDRYVSKMVLDGAGKALVSHRAANVYPVYGYDYDVAGGYGEQQTQLTVLGTAAMDAKSTVDVDTWATLQGAIEGRALFQVPDGLLVFNIEDPTSPWPQAWFATTGWPQALLVHDRDILFAAGRYGIYRFDVDASNLLEPAAN